MATNEKQARVVKTIGTHSGVFHCDEVLACYMLKQLPEYEAAEIIRSRDPKVSYFDEKTVKHWLNLGFRNLRSGGGRWGWIQSKNAPLRPSSKGFWRDNVIC